MAQAPTNKMRLRMLVLMILFTVLFAGILIARLANLQIVRAEELQSKAISQQMSALEISADRGEIRDRNGKKLAVSATVWNVVVDPVNVDTENGQEELIANSLAPILQMDAGEIKERCLKENTRHVFLKKRVEKPVQEAVIKFITDNKINAIHLVEDTKRYYPYGTLASTVIGFVNDENVGGGGVESKYNKILTGTPGVEVSAKTALNTDMPFRYRRRHDAKNGSSLVLTIDETIQHFLEKHLENAVVEHGIKNRAVGIVMDVNTGEVLAMSTKPDYDPNSFKEIYDQAALDRMTEVAIRSGGTDTEEYLKQKSIEQNLQWRNKAVSDLYEPGSVFKLITASAALDHGNVTVNDYFDCYGSVKVADRTIGCWKLSGHGNQSFPEVLKHSCNPAFVQIGQRLQGAAFYDYFDAFGLTKSTGIDLPGEAGSIYHTREQLVNNVVELSSSSFGQSFEVTPLQMLTSVCAVVNGGKLVTPYVVKQELDDQDNVVVSHEPHIRRQVISGETSRVMAGLMEQVVSDPDGSGRNSYIAGYRIGGKTGTAQNLTLEAATGKEEHWLSFAGIAPADDPQIAVLVVLDAPEVSNILGSTIAAPVVKYIMADVLPYMGIEPKYTAQELENLDVTTPNAIGKNLGDARALLEEKKLKIKVVGQGDSVQRQVPTPSTPIPREATVIVYTEEALLPEKVTVPDVFGLGTSLVNQALTNAGLNVSMTGGMGRASVASRQEPPAGTEVDAGTVVKVEMTATDVEQDSARIT